MDSFLQTLYRSDIIIAQKTIAENRQKCYNQNNIHSGQNNRKVRCGMAEIILSLIDFEEKDLEQLRLVAGERKLDPGGIGRQHTG